MAQASEFTPEFLNFSSYLYLTDLFVKAGNKISFDNPDCYLNWRPGFPIPALNLLTAKQKQLLCYMLIKLKELNHGLYLYCNYDAHLQFLSQSVPLIPDAVNSLATNFANLQVNTTNGVINNTNNGNVVNNGVGNGNGGGSTKTKYKPVVQIPQPDMNGAIDYRKFPIITLNPQQLLVLSTVDWSHVTPDKITGRRKGTFTHYILPELQSFLTQLGVTYVSNLSKRDAAMCLLSYRYSYELQGKPVS